jgi:hypothetical protein
MDYATRIAATLWVGYLMSVGSANASEPGERDYWNHYKRTVGEWKVQSDTGSRHEDYLVSIKLSPAGSCLVTTSSMPNGSRTRADFQMLSGYDPAAKKWKEVAFIRGGHTGISYCHLEPGSDDDKADQVKLKVEMTLVMPDGTSRSGTMTWHVKVVTQDKIDVLVTGSVVNGVKEPDTKMTYERLKEPIKWESGTTEAKAEPQ